MQPNFNIINISPKLLDFKKIKLHLINGNVKTKLLLLQALRWVTDISYAFLRRYTMINRINFYRKLL